MADKTIKVKVDVEADVQPSIAELKRLKLQLKETTDPAEFKQLQQTINDTEDAIKAARTGADNFAEILGTLPGPIGNIGNAVGGTLQNLKQFGALKFNDIKASFVDLGKDVVDAGKGLLKLTGITKVYEVTTAATSKALQFFGISLNASNTAAKALGATLATLTAATGLIAVVALIDLVSTAWDNYSNKAERAEDAQKKLNETLLKGSKTALDAESASVKRTGDLLLAQAKARGANADEIYKIEQSNRKLLLQSQERYYNDLKNKDSDEAIAALNNIKSSQNEIKIAEANFQASKLEKSKQASDKLAQQTKVDLAKDVADRKKTLEEITKNEKEAAISLLDERDQQRRKIVNDYNAQIKLAADNNRDTVVLEEAKLNAIKNLNDKFDKEDADKKKERLEKEKDFWNKAKDEATKGREKQYEDGLKALDREVNFIGIRNQTLLQGTKAYFQGRLDLIDAQEKRELADKELTEQQKLLIEKKYQKLRDDVRKDEQTSNAMAVAATLDSLAKVGSAIASSLDEEAKTSKSAFEKRKKIQKATAVMSAASGIIQILAQPSTLPSPADFIVKGLNAAALGIATAVQIKNIDKVQFEGGGGGSSTTSAPMPKYNSPTSMSIPQIQTGQGINASAQIGETITVAQRPIRAYVVSQDISSQQALDRRTSRAATFSAG